eukprot:gene16319-11804_t
MAKLLRPGSTDASPVWLRRQGWGEAAGGELDVVVVDTDRTQRKRPVVRMRSEGHDAAVVSGLLDAGARPAVLVFECHMLGDQQPPLLRRLRAANYSVGGVGVASGGANSTEHLNLVAWRARDVT